MLSEVYAARRFGIDMSQYLSQDSNGLGVHFFRMSPVDSSHNRNLVASLQATVFQEEIYALLEIRHRRYSLRFHPESYSTFSLSNLNLVHECESESRLRFIRYSNS